MPKILLVNEASYLDTGYGRYGRELMKRLLNTGHEIAELACHHQIGNEKHQKLASQYPWKIFPGMPAENNNAALDHYKSHPLHSFGLMAFEETLLAYPADYVLSIRDYWMDSWIHDSPFRPYFNHIQLAPVDGIPQNPQWIEFYSRCEGLLTYNDWSCNVLKDYGLDAPAAPFAADEHMYPRDRRITKLGMEIPPERIIIGMVSRNQPRKLYDELFRTFAKLNLPNIYLYCHTATLDQGADIASLLLKYNISNKVYFTYKCTRCGHITARHYNNHVSTCYNCGHVSAGTCGPGNFVNNEELARVFNCFDIYTQYANSEGLGIPQIEAAACAIPVLSTDYSAMSDVVRKVGGYPISVLTYKLDNETGRDFAIPDGDDLIRGWKTILSDLGNYSRLAYESYHKNYSWDKLAKPWVDKINSLSVKGWHSPQIRPIAEFSEHPHMSNREYVRWLIINVLGDLSKLGTYYEHSMVNSLNINSEGFGGGPTRHSQVNRETFYKRLSEKAQFRNFWEGRR